MRRTFQLALLASSLVLCLGSSAATTDECRQWPDYRPGAVQSTGRAMLIEIRQVAKEKLKKGGSCDQITDPAEKAKCRRQWTAVLGAQRRVWDRGRTWPVSCANQWTYVSAALKHAKEGNPLECFKSLYYVKGK